MKKAKGPDTNFIFDLVNPNMDMFTRDGELPSYAIIATHSEPTSNVEQAQITVMEALSKLIPDPEKNLILIRQDRIEMEGGDIMTLTLETLLMSLQYDIGEAKLLCIELIDTTKITIH